MRKNRYYTLVTKEEIPNEEERRAVNCYFADLTICDKRVAGRCRQESYRLWRWCPKQTKKIYNKKESL